MICVLIACFASSSQTRNLPRRKTEFVERKTVEYLLKKPCFVDCRGFPCSTPILLEYVPSYNSFQDTPKVKDLR